MKAHNLLTLILFLYSSTVYASDDQSTDHATQTALTGFQQFRDGRSMNLQDHPANNNDQQPTMPRSTDSTERLAIQLITPEAVAPNSAGGGASSGGTADQQAPPTLETQYPVAQKDNGSFVVQVPLDKFVEGVDHRTEQFKFSTLTRILYTFVSTSDFLAATSSGLYLWEKHDGSNACPHSIFPEFIGGCLAFSSIEHFLLYKMNKKHL